MYAPILLHNFKNLAQINYFAQTNHFAQTSFLAQIKILAQINFFEAAFYFVMAVVLIFGITVIFGAPYVPSLKSELRKMFKHLYKLSSKDLLIDLGSGDGVVLKVASEDFGAQTLGYEIHPVLSLLSRLRLRKIRHLAKVKTQNIYTAKFPEQTTVVYVFGDSKDIVKLVQKVQSEATRLSKSLHLISNGFEVPGHKIVKTYRTYYLYLIDPEKSQKKNNLIRGYFLIYCACAFRCACDCYYDSI